MTADERAVRLEHQRFIDDVVARAAERAGIPNTPEARAAHIDRVVARVAEDAQRRESAP
jgi:hypothetical protein